MLTYQELTELALLRTGQYILDIEDIEIDKDRLELIIKSELQWFSQYNPVRKQKDFILYDDKEFTEETDGVIPLNITNIRRRRYQAYPLFNASVGRFATSLRWRYISPYLTFQYPKDIYTVDYYAPHIYKDEKIDTLDLSSNFIDLFIARFMISIGSGRASFVLNDIPITTNASDLLSDGKELLQATQDLIRETSSYHLAIRM